MTIVTVRTVYFYVLKNRSELAIAYPDELTGEVPQAKKGWVQKCFRMKLNIFPRGTLEKLRIKLEISQKILAHQAMLITKSEKSTC